MRDVHERDLRGAVAASGAGAPVSSGLARDSAWRNVDELRGSLSTSSDGLTGEQVPKMRERYGRNELAARASDSLVRCLWRAFVNPFSVTLFVLALVSIATDVVFAPDVAKSASTAFIILVMVATSGVIRLVLELRARGASDQLDRMIRDRVIVRRDGREREVSVGDLVVGDVVLLHAGERIPADLRLIQTRDLFVSQAAITGESAIVEKRGDTLDAAIGGPITQLDNLALMATTVISGSGEGIVVAVGRDTVYGGVSDSVSGDGPDDSFRRGASSIAWVMLRFMAVLIPVVFAILGLTGADLLDAFAFSLSVAVGLMPEMLPMVISACLAKGSLAMFRKRAIVRNIDAMQGFGSMDTLCFDKTGTLTSENILLEYYTDVLGNESAETLDLAYLNSSYHSGVRNPIDNAVLACSTMPGREAHFATLARDARKVDEIPFDYPRTLVSTLVDVPGAGRMLIAKGDVRQVVARCTHVAWRGETYEMGEGDAGGASAIVDEMLADGMKVIAVARRRMDGECITPDDERGLTLVGYLAFFDAPKPSAATSIDKLARLGVTPKLLTGDRLSIALSVCRRVGIDDDATLCGGEIDALDEVHLAHAVERTSVFAELTPAQKACIVARLRANGHSVGFLGDGINDIPALAEASVGISVDTAVDATKDAADVVLLEKDLDVLEQGVLEGRKTFANMLKYIKVTASSNFGNILSIVLAAAFLPFLPMTSVQLLLLNLLYDVLCIVLPWDRVDVEETRAPRDWSGRTLGRFMVTFGPVSSLFDIVTFLVLFFAVCPALCGGTPYAQISDPALQTRFVSLFQTGWFLESLWTQLMVLHCLRTSKLPLVQSRPSIPVMVVTVTGVVALTALTFSGAGAVFGLTPLSVGYLGFLVAVCVLYFVLVTLAKGLYQRRWRELI